MVKLTNNYVKSIIKDNGFDLLSENWGTKLHVKCSNGHLFYMNLNVLQQQGFRCPICRRGRKWL